MGARAARAARRPQWYARPPGRGADRDLGQPVGRPGEPGAHYRRSSRSVLRSTGLDPACLSLEITETVMVRDADGLGEVLQALKAVGVRLVLDDFGTGYSSLSYLTRLPLDVLKVDRSFVDGLGNEPRDTAITETIIAMSRALSLDVVAEGVETADHVRELSRLGCGLAQGYHFSRALPGARDHPRARARAVAGCRRSRADQPIEAPASIGSP